MVVTGVDARGVEDEDVAPADQDVGRTRLGGCRLGVVSALHQHESRPEVEQGVREGDHVVVTLMSSTSTSQSSEASRRLGVTTSA